MLHDGDTFKHDGRRYKIEFPHDDSGEAPWDMQSFGIVSDWTRNAKGPGQMVLCTDHSNKRYFDFAGTCAQYRAGGGCTRKQASECAEADFKRFKDWCEDRWSYIGVMVTLLDEDGDETEYSASLWGIESDCDDYHLEVARGLANDCAALAIDAVLVAPLADPVL